MRAIDYSQRLLFLPRPSASHRLSAFEQDPHIGAYLPCALEALGMNDRQADLCVVAAVVLALLLLALNLTLSGCSTQPYPIKKTVLKLPGQHPMMGASDPTSPTVTIFSQQQGILAMVCGAVVQYANGEPAAAIPGNCSTPAGIIAGLVAPLSLGLGAAVWSAP